MLMEQKKKKKIKKNIEIEKIVETGNMHTVEEFWTSHHYCIILLKIVIYDVEK